MTSYIKGYASAASATMPCAATSAPCWPAFAVDLERPFGRATTIQRSRPLAAPGYLVGSLLVQPRAAAQDAAAFPACLVQCRASIPAPSARLGWSGCSGLPDASCVCWRLMPMAPLHSPANPLPVRKSVADSEIGSRLPTLQRFVFVFGMQLPHSDTQRQHRLRNLMPSSFLIYHCAY